MQTKTFSKIKKNKIALLNLDLDTGIYQEIFPNVNFQGKPIYWVTRLSVPREIRNQGIATKLMTEMIDWLDINRYCTILSINPYGDLNLEQLLEFYKKFEFIFNDENIGYRLNK